MSESENAIVVKNISKSFRLPHEQHSGIKQLLLNLWNREKGYEVQHVLKDISFDIKKGEFFGIVGRNGSGKSTLLKTIAGIYVADKGEMGVYGSLTPFIELGVGFNPELTGRENIFLNGALLGFSRKEMEALYDEIVEFAELERFMDQRLKNYSSGMQVRLAFSIAIQANSDILLLDEVLAVGDEAFQQKCFNYFNELRLKKKTVILVTHDMSSVERFCTRAMMIEDGKIKIIGSASEVADEYRRGNIPSDSKVDKDANKKTTDAQLEISIDQTAEVVEIGFDISTKLPAEQYYVGMTIFKDDSNIAEINSIDTTTGTHLIYRLNTALLNPGTYNVSAALFDRSNRNLVAIAKSRKRFLIPGHDISRGGGMRLESSWITGKK